ncbi:MAG: dTMP kinase [Magnetovibrionaceae bacterium]
MGSENRPPFITFEGGEGGGKSTQIKRLAAFLEERGVRCCLTREPGGCESAEDIRALLVSGETNRWGAMTEVLLHYAARREHLTRRVMPALGEGEWVLCDRYADSTLAYQGYGFGIDPETIRRLHRLVIGGFKPDLTFILDLPVEVGLGRAAERDGAKAGPAQDRYERMDRDFHERLRKGFLDIASKEPGRCIVLDANREPDEIAAEVTAEVERRFHRKFGSPGRS